MKPSIGRRALVTTAALAITVATVTVLSAATSPARASDPTLTILTSGDRVTIGPGATNPLGGTVSYVPGVEYRLSGAATRAACSYFNADGNCVFDNIPAGNYTVTQASAPTGSSVPWNNYFLNPTLGVGPVSTTGGASGVTAVNYNSFTVNVTAAGNSTVNGNTNFPVGNTTANVATTAGDVAARSGRWAVSRYNPPPPVLCSRKIALLFDLSASITAPLLARYKTAATQFVNALRGTATTVKIYTFGTTANVTTSPSTNFAPAVTDNPADVARLLGYINGLVLPSGQYTNWDAGIWQIAASGIHYSEALVLTDGDPTAMSSTGAPDAVSPVRTRLRAVEAGIFAANALKAEGTRIVAVGLDPTNAGTNNAGSIANLNAISGKDRGSDYYLIPFDSLDGVLEHLAIKDCAKLTIEKTGSPKVYDHVGQAVTYTFRVTNTSPADGFPLHNITVHDDRLGTITNCNPRTLAPGQSATCTATHVITQGDLNAGNVINTAHATGTTDNGNEVTSGPDQEIVTADQEAGLKVTKVASPRTYNAPGQPISYTYTVTNSGNVTLTGVTLTDARAAGITCTPPTPATLNPGQVMTCTGTTTTTQADVDAGSIPNTATATGDPPNSKPPVTGKADDEVFARRTTSMTILKSHTPATFTGPGQTIDYTYVITNTGNVPLDNLRLTDTTIPGPFACAPVALGGTLAPSATTTCTASYVTTTADADAGFVKNTAVTTGTPPAGLDPPQAADSNDVPGAGAPGIQITKSAFPRTFNAPGQTITYTYILTNVGALTLTNVQLADTKIPGPFTCAPVAIGGALTAGASTTCTALYVTTQADVDAGSIVNVATDAGQPPTGPVVTSPPAQEEVPAEVTEAIDVTKTASPRTYHGLGAKITYAYVVTNTGNVTLHNVTVSDNRITGLTCTPPQGSALAPGAVMHCTATHVITQADLDAGIVPNTVNAAGRPPAGGEVTGKADDEVIGSVVPQLHITKTAHPPVYTRHGQPITYTYVVTNTGNVILRNVTVTDTRWGPVDCPRTTLVPGESMTCTFTHAISAEDLSDGSIFNSAAAAGRGPDGKPVESPPDHALVTGMVVLPLPEVPVTG